MNGGKERKNAQEGHENTLNRTELSSSFSSLLLLPRYETERRERESKFFLCNHYKWCIIIFAIKSGTDIPILPTLYTRRRGRRRGRRWIRKQQNQRRGGKDSWGGERETLLTCDFVNEPPNYGWWRYVHVVHREGERKRGNVGRRRKRITRMETGKKESQLWTVAFDRWGSRHKVQMQLHQIEFAPGRERGELKGRWWWE